MDKTPSLSDERQALSRVGRALEICDAFASAWKLGNRPRIREYLGDSDKPASSLLLHELLMIELDIRRQRREKPALEEYCNQFPAHADLIAAIFATPRKERPDALEAGVTIGDFRVEKRIGAGGMGIVYLARQLSLNRLVALKVLGCALTNRSDIARFQREAQAIAKLNHPGVAGVYFVGQDREICYLAMEYIDGISVREVINRLSSHAAQGQGIDTILEETASAANAREVRFDDPTLTYTPEPSAEKEALEPEVLARDVKRLISSTNHIRRSCELAPEAAVALAHAHERGVVHRDIKPENLLLDRRGSVHVIDFGLARFYEDATLTNTGALVGTPMYMSPEQVTGRIGLDHRTDIYSLGLVLYEMLTLARPFSSPTRDGVLRQIVTKAMVPLTWKNSAVPQDLESVIHKATAKDPDERYQNSAELAGDLERFLDSKPVLATPYRYRFDERSLAATRPGSVILVAFFEFMLALAAIYFAIPTMRTVSFLLSGRKSLMLNACVILLVGVLAYLFYALGRGLLRGSEAARSIARAAFSATSVFAVGVSLYCLYPLLHGPRTWSDELNWDMLPYAVLVFGSASFASILPIVVLSRRKTRDWFRYASQLRNEFRHQRTEA
jgi:serine/threonine protein kinase